MAGRTYEGGLRNGKIQALEEDVDDDRARLLRIEEKVDGLSAKVNHIYGAALALGALAGAIVAAIAAFA